MNLNNAYSNASTTGELVTWTQTRLLELVSEMQDNVAVVQSSPYTSLTEQFFDSTLTFNDNATGLKYYNVSYMLGYQLVCPLSRFIR